MTFLGDFRWTGAFCAHSCDGVNRQSLLINAIFLEDITGGGTSHGNLLKAPYVSDLNIIRSDAVKMLSLNKLRLGKTLGGLPVLRTLNKRRENVE